MKIDEKIIREHQFQEEQPPGLYPEQPTVCSCGDTPGTRPPEGDWDWWVTHLTEVAKVAAEARAR